AIAWACTDSRLKAIAPFYGANPRPLEVVKRSCPVVGSYPGRDFTAGAGRSLETALAQHGIAHDIKIYPDSRHSFFNDTRPAHDKEAADDSWCRVLKFFGEQLVKKNEVDERSRHGRNRHARSACGHAAAAIRTSRSNPQPRNSRPRRR